MVIFVRMTFGKEGKRGYFASYPLESLFPVVFAQRPKLASSFKSSQTEMVMHDLSGNLFVYKENKARSLAFSQTANVLLSLRPNSQVISSFHNLLKGFAPVEMQQMFP